MYRPLAVDTDGDWRTRRACWDRVGNLRVFLNGNPCESRRRKVTGLIRIRCGTAAGPPTRHLGEPSSENFRSAGSRALLPGSYGRDGFGRARGALRTPRSSPPSRSERRRTTPCSAHRRSRTPATACSTASLGLWPGTSITGFPPGIVVPPGVTDTTNAAAQQAQSDLTAAYVNAAGRPVDATDAPPTSPTCTCRPVSTPDRARAPCS